MGNAINGIVEGGMIMDRKIKFRGKEIESNEWIYGQLFCPLGRYPEIIAPFPDENGKVKYFHTSVYPKTVGQYIGLKDRDGKEIYEGDIIDTWSQGQHLSNGIIKWGKGTCRFFIGNSNNSVVWNLSGDKEGYESLLIVGNIYDNPELTIETEEYHDLE